MENEEINKYIGEKLLDTKVSGNYFRYKHFGQKPDSPDDWEVGGACFDYCSNAMAVLEKLLEKDNKKPMNEISIYPLMDWTYKVVIETRETYAKRYIGLGNTIHEAICHAAVEYLKENG